MKSDCPKWPEKREVSRHESHTFDDTYCYDCQDIIDEETEPVIGNSLYNKGRADAITAFNDWLKEQKPVVLPKKKDSGFVGHNSDGIPEFSEEGKENRGWNSCIYEFLRLNPQIRSEQ